MLFQEIQENLIALVMLMTIINMIIRDCEFNTILRVHGKCGSVFPNEDVKVVRDVLISNTMTLIGLVPPRLSALFWINWTFVRSSPASRWLPSSTMVPRLAPEILDLRHGGEILQRSAGGDSHRIVVRVAASHALGSVHASMSDFDETAEWLIAFIQSDKTKVQRSGPAQGLVELLTSFDVALFRVSLTFSTCVSPPVNGAYNPLI
eukprot:762152_1